VGAQFDELTLANSATKYAGLSVDSSGYLYVNPQSGGTQDHIYFLSPEDTSKGVRLRVDHSGNVAWMEFLDDKDGHDLSAYFNVQAGQGYNFYVNYGNALQLSSSALTVYVPGTFSTSDASGNTVLESLVVSRGTTGTPAAGLGAGLSWRAPNSTPTSKTIAFWEALYETVTASSEDSAVRLRVLEGGAYADSNNLFVISGKSGAIGIGHSFTPGTTTFKSKLAVNGSIGTAIRKISGGGDTLDIDDSTILCDSTTLDVTITLPAASTATGRKYTIKRIDGSANAVDIDPNGTEKLEGSSSNYALSAQYDFVTIQSDGTEWWIIATNF